MRRMSGYDNGRTSLQNIQPPLRTIDWLSINIHWLTQRFASSFSPQRKVVLHWNTLRLPTWLQRSTGSLAMFLAKLAKSSFFLITGDPSKPNIDPTVNTKVAPRGKKVLQVRVAIQLQKIPPENVTKHTTESQFWNGPLHKQTNKGPFIVLSPWAMM